MNHFDQASEKRELLAITYNSNAVFEKDSPELTSHADHELRQVARMIHLVPQMVVDVEVRSNASDFDASSNMLRGRRVRAVKDALVHAGVDTCRIRTNTDSTHWSNHSEVTLILTALAESGPSMMQAPPQDAWKYGCSACW